MTATLEQPAQSTATAIAPTATPTPAPAPKIKKVSLGGIKAKETAAAPAADKYPILPDLDQEVSKLATAVRADQEVYDALEGALKVNKARLRTLAGPFWFQTNHGKAVIPSSVRCQITEPESEEPDAPRIVTGAVLVTFTNRYGEADEEAVLGVIGAEKTARYFREKFSIVIDGDQIPAACLETKDEGTAQEKPSLIDELQELFDRHGCLGALSSSSKIVPLAEFHTARHAVLTPADNAALDKILPCQAQVKSKNVK